MASPRNRHCASANCTGALSFPIWDRHIQSHRQPDRQIAASLSLKAPTYGRAGQNSRPSIDM